MSKKPKSDTDLGWFFLKPFLPYLKPHKMRLIIALVGMVGVAFFGAFSLLLLEPPLRILLEPQVDEKALTVKETLEETRPVLQESVNNWHATGAEPNELFESIEELTLALDASDVEEAEADDEEEEAKRKLLDKIPGFAGLRDWAVEAFEPVKEWGNSKKDEFELWMKNNRLDALWLFAAILICATLFKAISEFLAKYFIAYTFYDLVMKLKADIFSHIIRLDYAFFSKHTTGFLESRIGNDVNQIRIVLEAILSNAIQEPLEIVGLLAVLFVLAPQLTWIALVVIVLGFGPLLYLARRMKKISKRSMKKSDAPVIVVLICMD